MRAGGHGSVRSCGDSGSLSHCSVIFQTLKSSLMITIEAISKGKRGGEGAPEGPSLERTLALVAVCLSQMSHLAPPHCQRNTREKEVGTETDIELPVSAPKF